MPLRQYGRDYWRGWSTTDVVLHTTNVHHSMRVVVRIIGASLPLMVETLQAIGQGRHVWCVPLLIVHEPTAVASDIKDAV